MTTVDEIEELRAGAYRGDVDRLIETWRPEVWARSKAAADTPASV